MRTARLLTVSHSIPCIWRGESLHSGGGWTDPLVMWSVMHAGKPTRHVDRRMTHTCENITLPQTSFAGGNNITLAYHNLSFVITPLGGHLLLPPYNLMIRLMPIMPAILLGAPQIFSVYKENSIVLEWSVIKLFIAGVIIG